MEGKIVIPVTISGFTEFIKIAYDTAEEHLSDYGIDPVEFAKVTPLFNEFTSLEALCANAATATKANRDARNQARQTLTVQWRNFLNKEIRLNDVMSVAEKEVFGIVPRDDTRTSPSTPKETGKVTATRTGAFHYDLVVEETVTGKKKRPADSTGSNLYVAISDVNDPAPHRSTFRYEGFSSNCHHTVIFAEDDLAKRAWAYARYSNQHGQEGPEGPLTSFVIN